MTGSIDGQLLKRMFAAGSRYVAREADRINRMNVFPVPDGDTGSNLAATLQRMESEMQASGDGRADKVADAAAKGALLGARGNSGVIFSQILRGFADGVSGGEVLTSEVMANAFVVAADRAFQAVIRPVEGTILTVVNDASAAAALSAMENSGVEAVLADALDQARLTLARTPQMLDKLRLAGVVDAGGQGFVVFLEGMLAAVRGETVETGPAAAETQTAPEMEWRYCTEIVISADAAHADEFRSRLADGNDSLLVAADAGVVKIHVHTEDPAAVLTMALAAGELIDIKIENMRRQHTERFVPMQHEGVASAPTVPDSPVRAVGAVAVVAGEGLKKVFQSLGAAVVDGGQSMNPSTEDILRAVCDAPSKTVFILPNNSNIVASAKTAAELSGRDARVVPTETIPQGIAALIDMEGGADADATFQRMSAATRRIVSAEITCAIRDAEADGVRVRKGDFIAIVEGRIVLAERDLNSAMVGAITRLAASDIELITLFFGAEFDESTARAIIDPIASKHTEVEFQILSGGQPHYHFVISAE